MATVTEEAAPVAVVAPAPEKVDEVKEAGAVEAPEKVEKAPAQRLGDLDRSCASSLMAIVTEEAAPVAVVAPAPEKVDEVKEAGAVEAPEKVEKAPKPVAEEGKKAEEVKKAKKPRSRKPKSAGPHHPPYFEMIKEAILAQDGKVGASPYAIAKHMGEKHRDVLPANYRKVLAVQLRNFAAKGRLVKVKASFKLAAAEEKKATAAAPKAKKAAPVKRKRAAAAPAKKKPAAPAEARKARAKRARKAAPAPAQPMPKPKQQARPVRAAVARKAANKASA